MKLAIEKNEALADIDYFIHEIKENGKHHSTIDRLKKGIRLVQNSNTSQEINNHMVLLCGIFQGAF